MNTHPHRFAESSTARADAAAAGPRLTIERYDSSKPIEQEWRQLGSSGIGTIFQSFDWVDAYTRNVLAREDATPAILIGRLDGNPAFILPLAVRRRGGSKCAEWIGGPHSGYNFGLWSHEAAAHVGVTSRAQIRNLLRNALDGVDCAILMRMPRLESGIAQPLAPLSRMPSATRGYSLDLAEDFADILAPRNGGVRKRKIRNKEKRIREHGVLEHCTITDPQAAAAALEFFLEHKALRLAEQSLPNSFAAPGVAAFLRDLLARSHDKAEPALEMAHLSVDGVLRAVAGSGIRNGRLNVFFMTFVRDEVTTHSPGQVLTYRHIEESCARKLTAYDLGVGYEPYKTSWCDIDHQLDDRYVAFTARGAVAISAIRLAAGVKHQLRKNEALWGRIKSLRSGFTRRKPA